MTILSIRCYREPSFVRISETKSTNSASEHVESVRLSAKAILKQMSVLYQQNVIVVQRWKNVQILQIYLCYFYFGCANFFAVYVRTSLKQCAISTVLKAIC